MEAQAKRLRKYSGITLGAVLIMAFVLVQPTMNQANAVGVEGLPSYDKCISVDQLEEDTVSEDPISMNTVRSGNIVKTVHAEKEVFRCLLDQGNLPVIVDVTTYVEIYEDIVDREVIKTSALVTTCLKEPGPLRAGGGGATVIDCESYTPSSDPVPVSDTCLEPPEGSFSSLTHPQEMNTVNKGSIAKTVEAQKETFLCDLDGFESSIILCAINLSDPTFNSPICFYPDKKVDVILFTEIYENLSTQEVVDVQFHSMRCVVLINDSSDELRDAIVETCQFSSIEN